MSTPKAPVNIIPGREQKLNNYRFIDKDPELDFVLAKIQQSRRSPEWIERETEKLGRRVSRHAIIGWVFGGTKRPQNYTLTSVMMALGFEREWKENHGPRPKDD